MGSFGDLIYDISSALGGGLGRGAQERFEEEAEFGKQERGFKRLAPIRRKKKAEEIGYELGPEAAAEVEAGTFAGTVPYKEKREAAKLAADRAELASTLGPILEAYMPPTITEAAPRQVSEYGPRAPVVEATPFKVSPGTPKEAYAHLFGLAGKRLAASKPSDRAHQPYDDAYRLEMSRSGNPELAQQKGIEAAAKAAGAKVGAGIEATQGRPPTATPAERKEIADMEAGLQQGTRVLSLFKEKYAGVISGGILGRARARYLGPSKEEGQFRAAAAVLRRNLRQQFSGLAVTNPELWMNIEAIPDPEKVSAEMFVAVVEENMTNLREKLQIRRQQYERAAGQVVSPGVLPGVTKPQRSRPKGLPARFEEE